MLVIGLWYILNAVIFRSAFFPFYGLKRGLLKLFGAEVGSGVVIKPRVNIKYPWKLVVGANTWIGEEAWIDNLDQVNLGPNVCISQGAYLFCGNHDYKSPAFDLLTAPITLEEGAWVAAKGVVCPGVIMKSHAVLSAGSLATGTLKPYTVYRGNPAEPVRKREIGS